MSKTVKTNSKKGLKKHSSKGKKGGISMISPEVMGAMTGAAIGGVTGLVLANKKTRDNLAVVKDKAVNTANDVLSNVSLETSGVKEDIRKNVNQVSNAAAEKIDKSIPKK